MAMSLKKIGSLMIGGAMVATALASGVSAVEKIGFTDYKELKDELVKDGQPNCYVVVGANVPSTMDVVSAADIAAKIGSLCYKESELTTGSADLKVHVSADASKVEFNTSANNTFYYAVSPDDGDYPISTIVYGSTTYNTTNTYGVTRTLSTLVKIDDVDLKSTTYENDDDGIELGFYVLKNESYELGVDLVGYASVITKDGALDTSDTALIPGLEIPFLGQPYIIVKLDTDNDDILLGKLVYNGVLSEGESYDLGNGYEAKIKAVLEPTSGGTAKVDVQILKDGKVIAEKFDTVSNTDPLVVVGNSVGVVVVNAYKNVAQTTGYADVYLVNNIKTLHLGDKYEGDYKIYAVVQSSPDEIKISKDTDIQSTTYDGYKVYKTGDGIICGIALVDDTDPTNDDNKLGSKGDTFSAVDDYFKFKVDDKIGTDTYKVYVYSDVTKDAKVDVGQTVSVLNADITLNKICAESITPVTLTAPIAKLDTEIGSLDKADKNLVLVGGPVANKLTKELVDMGKLQLNNTSPATIALIKGVANGHDVIVVAGGDREKTREAALALIKNL